MSSRRQIGLATGQPFPSPPSAAPSSYSQSQIMPYSQPHGDLPRAKPNLSMSWSLDDPELKRRKRVASYTVYTVEGRMKSSIRKSVRWLKNKYLEVRYGWW